MTTTMKCSTYCRVPWKIFFAEEDDTPHTHESNTTNHHRRSRNFFFYFSLRRWLEFLCVNSSLSLSLSSHRDCVWLSLLHYNIPQTTIYRSNGKPMGADCWLMLLCVSVCYTIMRMHNTHVIASWCRGHLPCRFLSNSVFHLRSHFHVVQSKMKLNWVMERNETEYSFIHFDNRIIRACTLIDCNNWLLLVPIAMTQINTLHTHTLLYWLLLSSYVYAEGWEHRTHVHFRSRTNQR